jgi:hypothetical protein
LTLATAPSAAADFSPAAVSLRGLDWVNFFLAWTLGGFGPYVAVYLADQKWTQEEVGFVLSASAFAGLLSQVPGGDGCYPLEAGDPGTGCDISLGRRAYVACVCFSSSHPCNRHSLWSLLRSPPHITRSSNLREPAARASGRAQVCSFLPSACSCFSSATRQCCRLPESP